LVINRGLMSEAFVGAPRTRSSSAELRKTCFATVFLVRNLRSGFVPCLLRLPSLCSVIDSALRFVGPCKC